MQRKIVRANQGITLVALVITIIVLIILAGVTINMILGENGIITKAKEGSQNMQNAAGEEQTILNQLYGEMLNSENGGGEAPNPSDPVVPSSNLNIQFEPNGDTTWRKSQSSIVTITAERSSSVDGTSLKYLWNQTEETPKEEDFIHSFMNGDNLTQSEGNGDNWNLWILAKDTEGNSKIEKSQAFYLDNTNPSQSGLSVQGGTEGANGWYKSNVPVQITPGEDEESGVAKLIYHISGAQIVEETEITEVNNSTSITIEQEGTSTIEVQTEDRAGNRSESTVLIVKKDSLGPNAFSISEENNIREKTGTSFKIENATTEDGTSGIAGYEYYVNGEKQESASITVSEAGDYTVYVKAMDNAGNATNSNTITVSMMGEMAITYDANGGTGAPEKQIKQPGENLTISSTIPTKTDSLFVGWSENASATEATYKAGQSYTEDRSLTLFAVWKSNSAVATLKLGDYVQYQVPSKSFTATTAQTAYTSNQTFNTSTYSGLWRVLYNDGTNGLQIVNDDCDGMAEIKFGTRDNGNWNLQRSAYNNYVDNLNQFCSNYVNPNYASKGRSLGSDPVDPADKITEMVYLEINGGSSGWKVGDDNYLKDIEAAENAGCFLPKGRYGSYLMASRRQTSDEWNLGRIYYFYLGEVIYNGNMGGHIYAHIIEDKTGTVTTQSSYSTSPATRAIRPVITLKQSLKLVSGEGTAESPYVLGI